MAFTDNDPAIFAEYAMDAANVEWPHRAVSFQQTDAHLAPVLDTL